MKYASITSVYKDEEDPFQRANSANYRPISIPSLLWKFYEKLLFDLLTDYAEKLLGKTSYCFPKDGST